MAESIQCYQCGTRMTLEELASNDGDCPECDVEIHLAEYLSKALADIAVLRTQQSGQGGEAVQVVAVIRAKGFGRVFEATSADSAYLHCSEGDQLMTVAQHNRIMAAATPADSRVVSLELLKNWVTGLQCGIISQRRVIEDIRELLDVKP